jgi:hypothetical protein
VKTKKRSQPSSQCLLWKKRKQKKASGHSVSASQSVRRDSCTWTHMSVWWIRIRRCLLCSRTFVQDGVCRPGNDHWMDSPTDFTTPTVRDRDSEFRFLQFIKHQGPCQVRSEKKWEFIGPVHERRRQNSARADRKSGIRQGQLGLGRAASVCGRGWWDERKRSGWQVALALWFLRRQVPRVLCAGCCC